MIELWTDAFDTVVSKRIFLSTSHPSPCYLSPRYSDSCPRNPLTIVCGSKTGQNCSENLISMNAQEVKREKTWVTPFIVMIVCIKHTSDTTVTAIGE